MQWKPLVRNGFRHFPLRGAVSISSALDASRYPRSRTTPALYTFRIEHTVSYQLFIPTSGAGCNGKMPLML